MTFYRERPVHRPRKNHKCMWCGEVIPDGSPCVYVSSMWDGDMSYGHMHTECCQANHDGWHESSPYDGYEFYSMVRGSSEPR